MDSRSLNSLRIYRESLAIRDLSEALASYFSYNGDLFCFKRYGSFRDDLSKSLVTDAVLITKEVEQVALSNSHRTRAKSLSFINVMIQNILACCNGLEKDGVKEKEYLNLLRREIKTFRNSYKKWKSSFQNDGNRQGWDSKP